MMKLNATLLAAVAVVGLGGAAAPDVIIVRDFGAVASCRALGEVRASSLIGGALANAAYSRTLAQLKRHAADLGATHVQIIDSASGLTGARMIGTAFLCPKA